MAAASTLDAIVHDLDQAAAALRAARAAGAGARLFSPPGAALTLGPGYWRALVDALTATHSGVSFEAVLDCADDAGAALAALGEGLGAVRFAGPPEVAARLADIAGQRGARLVDGPLPALDLGLAADPEAACRAALHCPEA
jgi:hypothetical protein